MPAQLAWVDQGTRAVWVPAGQSPPVPCIDHKPDFAVLAPGCREASEVGNYHPLPYLLPALALDMSNDSTTGLYLSRLASAIPCLAFILLAFALLWDGSAWSLLGPLAAITPMVLFVSSIVNPNGLELAACLAFAASVLRIARAPTHLPSRVWAAFALSGAVAILAWQLGPIFVIADLALGASLLGPAGLRTLRLSAGRRLRPPPLTLITATALYMVYELASGVTHSTFSISPVAQGLHEGLSQLVPVLGNSVGTFGALTVPLPFAAYWTWWLFVAAIIFGAMWVGGRRDRSLLIAVVALALAFPVLFFAWVYRSHTLGGAHRSAGGPGSQALQSAPQRYSRSQCSEPSPHAHRSRPAREAANSHVTPREVPGSAGGRAPEPSPEYIREAAEPSEDVWAREQELYRRSRSKGKLNPEGLAFAAQLDSGDQSPSSARRRTTYSCSSARIASSIAGA